MIDTSGPNDKLHIIVGQSMMMRGVSPMRRIYVGNPVVLQTYTAGPEETVVTAKTPGVSSLVIWDSNGKSCLYTVSADVDPSGLRQSLQDAYPNNVIEVVGSEDRLTLSGSVPTAEMSDAAAKLAANFAKDVVNSLRVVAVHGKQVQLKLRIAEVDRTKLEQFGVNLTRSAGNNVFGTSTQQFPSTQTSTSSGGQDDPCGVRSSESVFCKYWRRLWSHGQGPGATQHPADPRGAESNDFERAASALPVGRRVSRANRAERVGRALRR